MAILLINRNICA